MVDLESEKAFLLSKESVMNLMGNKALMHDKGINILIIKLGIVYVPVSKFGAGHRPFSYCSLCSFSK